MAEEYSLPDINRDWKANAQANAAALNIVWEVVSVEFGGVIDQEHLPDCGADPVNVARSITEALMKYKRGVTEDHGKAEWPLVIEYKNWRGETSTRHIFPRKTYFGSNQYHKEPQWLLEAWDINKGVMRTFAMRDMKLV